MTKIHNVEKFLHTLRGTKIVRRASVSNEFCKRKVIEEYTVLGFGLDKSHLIIHLQGHTNNKRFTADIGDIVRWVEEGAEINRSDEFLEALLSYETLR